MNCPVCNRTLATTLSICPSCGTMMNDSIREDLEIKPATVTTGNLDKKGASLMSGNTNQQKINIPAKPVYTKNDTADLTAKPSAPLPKTPPTVPTLVEFQSKNATIPDWRLKVQNAVRQRLEHQPDEEKAVTSAVYKTRLVTNGANALKTEVIEEAAPEIPTKNEKVANALKRIEQSRQAFLVEEKIAGAPGEETGQNKNFPFYIAARSGDAAKPSENKASVNVVPKPKLVTQARNVSGDLDTNKLPPLPVSAKIASSFDKVSNEIPNHIIEQETYENLKSLDVKTAAIEEKIIAAEEHEADDDLAPFSMRFNAGLFDLIIGSFTALILLAPFMLAGGEWLTFTGFLAFLATVSIVMFVYLTTSIGMFGRSFGMRLFSLELIDIEENEYPTFHQAAVSSSVYLLSLVFGGIGFLTMFFNDEKRAVHDIVSGTIVVKEI
ncbi:MAG: hypothetical protein JWN60_2442 [Acidobacteria bacterium]|nr:hypothetical protein [Acidobacteriota bacterium]